MKRSLLIVTIMAAIAILCSCSQKKAEFNAETVYLGDAVSGSEEKAEVLTEAEKGWEDYQKEAAKALEASGDKGPGESFNRSQEEEVVRLANAERAKAGLGPLAIDETLMAGAEIRAQEQQRAFSHTRPDGRSCDTIYDDLGYRVHAYGENLGMGGNFNAQSVMGSWMASPGHQANIMTGYFTKIGVGCYISGGVTYWAQIFTD